MVVIEYVRELGCKRHTEPCLATSTQLHTVGIENMSLRSDCDRNSLNELQ